VAGRGLGAGPHGACLAACLLLAACATKPYDPFRVPRSELRERIRTIAIMPLSSGDPELEHERVAGEVEPLLRQRLEAAGFRVVDVAEVRSILDQASVDVGGLFDPHTGRVIEDRYEPVRSALYRELGRRYQADAVLYARVEPVELFLTNGKVSYCGLEDDPVYWPGKLGVFSGTTTTVVALCLSASLRDMEGRDLYGIRHGLETVETYHEQTRAFRPGSDRLRDRARLADAVEKTVGPIAAMRAP
jgi:hypothetical protein